MSAETSPTKSEVDTASPDDDILEQEEHFIGRELQEVPPADPGNYCNARRWEYEAETDEVTGNDTEKKVFVGYCDNEAGKKTDHFGEGRCNWHGGASSGAPKHNQNAAKHHLSSDPHHYHENLPREEQQWITDMSEVIVRRVKEQKGHADALDYTLARRVAIKLHIVSNASKHIEEVTGLLQTIVTEHGSHEESSPLLKDVRQYDDSIFKNLRELGVLNDPESQKADALGEWREYMEQGHEQAEELEDPIDVDGGPVDG